LISQRSQRFWSAVNVRGGKKRKKKGDLGPYIILTLDFVQESYNAEVINQHKITTATTAFNEFE